MPKKLPVPSGSYKRAYEAMKDGATKQSLAASFKVSIQTLDRWLAEDEKLAANLQRGMAEFHDMHVAILNNPKKFFDVEGLSINQQIALMRQASTSAMFLLKSRFGYREGEQLEGNGPQLNVQIVLPAPMSEEELAKTVRVKTDA